MWQPVFMISGYILGILGLVMLIPASIDMSLNQHGWSPFLVGAINSLFFGATKVKINYE